MTPTESAGVEVGPAASPQRDLLIIGLGDALTGDAGAGIHVLNALAKYPAIGGVTLLDGGTGDVNLPEPIAHSPVVIAIAAVRDGNAAGMISYSQPTGVDVLPGDESAHGLRELFAAAERVGRFPEVHLFTVSVEEPRAVSMALTAPVAAAATEVARLVNTLAVRLLSLRKDIPE